MQGQKGTGKMGNEGGRKAPSNAELVEKVPKYIAA
jgi:hypothetical protein